MSGTGLEVSRYGSGFGDEGIHVAGAAWSKLGVLLTRWGLSTRPRGWAHRPHKRASYRCMMRYQSRTIVSQACVSLISPGQRGPHGRATSSYVQVSTASEQLYPTPVDSGSSTLEGNGTSLCLCARACIMTFLPAKTHTTKRTMQPIPLVLDPPRDFRHIGHFRIIQPAGQRLRHEPVETH